MQVPVTSSDPIINQRFVLGAVVIDQTTGQSYFPTGLFTGTRAITQQTYTEANVKNGLQYEFAGLPTTLTAGAFGNTLLIVGAKPIIIKTRVISFTGAGITAIVYESPTVSANGTAAPIFNLSRITPTATTAQMFQGPTVTANGTQISAPTVSLGSTGQGQSVFGTFAAPGAERILKANTTYLLQIQNNDTSSCKVSAYVSWYEGTPDLPLP